MRKHASILDKCKNSPSFLKCPDLLWGPVQAAVETAPETGYTGLERPWRETNRSFPFSAELWNEFNSTPGPPYVLMACITTSLLVFLFFHREL